MSGGASPSKSASNWRPPSILVCLWTSQARSSRWADVTPTASWVSTGLTSGLRTTRSSFCPKISVSASFWKSQPCTNRPSWTHWWLSLRPGSKARLKSAIFSRWTSRSTPRSSNTSTKHSRNSNLRCPSKCFTFPRTRSNCVTYRARPAQLQRRRLKGFRSLITQTLTTGRASLLMWNKKKLVEYTSFSSLTNRNRQLSPSRSSPRSSPRPQTQPRTCDAWKHVKNAPKYKIPLLIKVIGIHRLKLCALKLPWHS